MANTFGQSFQVFTSAGAGATGISFGGVGASPGITSVVNASSGATVTLSTAPSFVEVSHGTYTMSVDPALVIAAGVDLLITIDAGSAITPDNNRYVPLTVQLSSVVTRLGEFLSSAEQAEIATAAGYSIPSAATIASSVASSVLVTPANKLLTDAGGDVTYNNTAPPSTASISSAVAAAVPTVAQIWNALTSGLTTAGSVGKLLSSFVFDGSNNVKSTENVRTEFLSSTEQTEIATASGYTVPSAATIATAVAAAVPTVAQIWNALTSGLTTASSIGKLLSSFAFDGSSNVKSTENVRTEFLSTTEQTELVTAAGYTIPSAATIAAAVAAAILITTANKLATDSSGRVTASSVIAGGLPAADIESAMTAQGYTSARAGFLDVLSGIVAAVAAAILLTPANKIATDSGGEVNVNLSQAVAATETPGTVGHALLGAIVDAFGRWATSGTTFTKYALDNTTVVKSFTLDSSTAPTERS